MQQKTLGEKAKPEKKKRHKFIKRALKILLLLLAVLLVALAALLYAPIKTLASLKKVDNHPLYVMKYRSRYFFDLFSEVGTDWSVYQKVYKAAIPDACTSFAALNPENQAMNILQGTSQESTTWSIVYNLGTGGINLAMGKDYNQVHTFKLSMESQI